MPDVFESLTQEAEHMLVVYGVENFLAVAAELDEACVAQEAQVL